MTNENKKALVYPLCNCYGITRGQYNHITKQGFLSHAPKFWTINLLSATILGFCASVWLPSPLQKVDLMTLPCHEKNAWVHQHVSVINTTGCREMWKVRVPAASGSSHSCEHNAWHVACIMYSIGMKKKHPYIILIMFNVYAWRLQLWKKKCANVHFPVCFYRSALGFYMRNICMIQEMTFASSYQGKSFLANLHALPRCHVTCQRVRGLWIPIPLSMKKLDQN